MKQFLVRMDDDDYKAFKNIHLDFISVNRVTLSFNAFIVELLNEFAADAKTEAAVMVEDILKKH